MAATSIFLVSFRLSLNSLMEFGKCLLFVIRLKDSVAQAGSIKAKLLYFATQNLVILFTVMS